MSTDDSGYDRRSVLKATGGALAVAGVAAGPGGAKCLETKSDAPAYENCPPVDTKVGVLDAGTDVRIACTAGDEVYYYGDDADTAGYVPDEYVGLC